MTRTALQSQGVPGHAAEPKGQGLGAQAAMGSTTFGFGGPLPEKLAAMRAAGFVATELFPRDLYDDPSGPAYAIDALRDSGLAISAFQALRDYEGMPERQRRQTLGIAEQMMDQMGWLGAELLVLCANIHPQAVGDPDTCAVDLLRLAELAQSRGIRVAYEPIGWARFYSDFRNAWSLVRRIDHPSLGLLLDSLHVAGGGAPLAPLAHIDPAKLFLVELCDWPQARLPPFEIARHYRLFPGEGVGPLVEFVQRLDALGYRGLYSLEVINALYRHQSPLAVAQRGFAAGHALLAQALDQPPSMSSSATG